MKPARWSDPDLKLFPHQVGFTAPPVVIASDDLLNRPEDTIRAYCAALGIPFLAEALSWEACERPEVGWYGEGTGPWHDDLRASTGISRPTTEYPPLDGDQRLVEMLERSTPTTKRCWPTGWSSGDRPPARTVRTRRPPPSQPDLLQ